MKWYAVSLLVLSIVPAQAGVQCKTDNQAAQEVVEFSVTPRAGGSYALRFSRKSPNPRREVNLLREGLSCTIAASDSRVMNCTRREVVDGQDTSTTVRVSRRTELFLDRQGHEEVWEELRVWMMYREPRGASYSVVSTPSFGAQDCSVVD